MILTIRRVILKVVVKDLYNNIILDFKWEKTYNSQYYMNRNVLNFPFYEILPILAIKYNIEVIILTIS